MNSLTRTAAATAPAPPEAAGRDGRSQRWDAHRQARRTDLLRRTRKAIHRLGPDASMEEIAAAAKTSKPALYRYFADKQGLRRELGAVVVDSLRTAVLGAAQGAPTEEEGLRRMVAAYLELAERSPNVYFFVTAVDQDPTTGLLADEPLNSFFREVTGLVSDALTHYLNRAAPAEDPTHRAQFWPEAALGMVRAAGEAWLRTPDSPTKPSHREMTTLITGWLMHGIGGPQKG